MSVLLTCQVKVGDLTYTEVSGVEIVSSWKELGDTANLKLFGWVQEVEADGTLVGPLRKVEDIVAVGDPVEIRLGYDGQLRTEFKGYVAEVKLTVPFELRCEDEYWHLKRSPVNRSWANTTLHSLLRDLAKLVKPAGTQLVLGPGMDKRDLQIEGFRADRTTVADVLKKVKENYLVCAYFRNGKLFVGLPYTEFTTATAQEGDGSLALYGFQQNVVSDDLSYKRKEDVRIKGKVVAMHSNGKKTTTDAGDADGEERTITLRTDQTDKVKLKSMAQSQLDSFKYDGYRGSLTSFGVPAVVHSGIADLLDVRYPQRAGRYLVDKVTTTFGPEGFRRKVELGKRVTL